MKYRRTKSVDISALSCDLAESLLCRDVLSNSHPDIFRACDLDSLACNYNITLSSVIESHAPLKTKTIVSGSCSATVVGSECCLRYGGTFCVTISSEHKFWDPRYNTGVVCVISIGTRVSLSGKVAVIATVQSRSSLRVMFRAVTDYSVFQSTV